MKAPFCKIGNNNKWIAILAMLFWGIIISACEQPAKMPTSPFATPEVFISPIKGLTESFVFDAHRRVTAGQSFPVAYEMAKRWCQDAKWYGVVPFTSIERAFAIPLGNSNPSWFFRFGVPEEDRELIVEVLNNKIVGINETKIPDYIEPPLKELEPLPDGDWNILDSIEVLEKYLEVKDNLLARFPHMLVDYRLAQPKGYSHPVWTLYDAHNLAEPLFIIDAVTGEVLPKSDD
ncbi:MAG: hypothetical protein QXT77_04755 [Candidatus Methanomethylicaceae archaeon]